MRETKWAEKTVFGHWKIKGIITRGDGLKDIRKVCRENPLFSLLLQLMQLCESNRTLRHTHFFRFRECEACLFSPVVAVGLLTRLSLLKMQTDHLINSFDHLLLACQMEFVG